MGSVSDRSNPRYFLTTGLLISGCIMFIFGFRRLGTAKLTQAYLFYSSSTAGPRLGWPACGRTMVHWYSGNERGRTVSFWISLTTWGRFLNRGPILILGMYWFNDWQVLFYLPCRVSHIYWQVLSFWFCVIRTSHLGFNVHWRLIAKINPSTIVQATKKSSAPNKSFFLRTK